MKTLVHKLLIISILSITLVSIVTIFSYVSHSTSPYRTATVAQNQPAPEILSGSYSNMINTLNANFGR